MDRLPQIIRDLVRIGATQRFGEINRLLNSREKRAEIHMKPESFWQSIADRMSPSDIGSLLRALSLDEQALTGWCSNWRSPVALLLQKLRTLDEKASFNIANSAIEWRLRKYGIGCLYYMTHIDNLLSISIHGILCYNKTRNIPHATLSDWHIQLRRYTLHDYVPLYFATHTPMQYCITHKFAPPIEDKNLVFIELNALSVFQLRGVRFTDGNAAASITAFYEDLTDLRKLDLRLVQRITRCYSPEYRRRKAAEVLVKDRVKCDCFLRFAFFSGDSKARFIEAAERWRDQQRGSPSGDEADPFQFRLEVDKTLY